MAGAKGAGVTFMLASGGGGSMIDMVAPSVWLAMGWLDG